MVSKIEASRSPKNYNLGLLKSTRERVEKWNILTTELRKEYSFPSKHLHFSNYSQKKRHKMGQFLIVFREAFISTKSTCFLII